MCTQRNFLLAYLRYRLRIARGPLSNGELRRRPAFVPALKQTLLSLTNELTSKSFALLA